MLDVAFGPQPPTIHPASGRDAARSAAILGSAGGLVALLTLALSGVIVPRPEAPVSVVPTPDVRLDLGAAPTQIGGQLTISGARDGSMEIVSADSDPGYEPTADGSGIRFMRGEVVVSGADGDVVLDPASGEVTRIQYGDLSFYLDPGECTATPGGRNDELGLVHLRLDCSEIADLRGGEVIAVAGVIAVPADALGDRGSLPPVGGHVSVGETPLDVVDGVAIVDGLGPVGDSRVPVMAQADTTSGLAILLDPEKHEFVLTGVQVEGEFAELAEECPLAAEALGRPNPQTTATRLTIDCAGATLPDGGTGIVTGSLVVDVIDLVED